MEATPPQAAIKIDASANQKGRRATLTIDHGGEALVGLVGAHCDALEFLELAEEVLDEMPPFVHLLVDGERLCSTRMLGDDGLGAARVEFGDDGVAVERLVGDQRVEGQSLDERLHTHREALSGQQHEAHEIAKRISERQDFRGHAALRTADRLALRLPFAPCPWRWTLTMVASTMAYSMSGSLETASNSRFEISALTQPRERMKTLFHWPNEGGRSLHGLPVRAVHSTASTNSRLSLPRRPGSPVLPRQSGSIFAHWASVKTNRSIPSLNHNQARMRILHPNRTEHYSCLFDLT